MGDAFEAEAFAQELVSGLSTPRGHHNSSSSPFGRLSVAFRKRTSSLRNVSPMGSRRGSFSGEQEEIKEKTKSLRKIDVKEGDRDVELNNRFGLENEVTVQEYPCTLKKAMIGDGIVHLTQKYICFTAKKFGKRYKKIISFKSVHNIKRKDRDITIMYKESSREKATFLFKEGDVVKIEGFFRGLWVFNTTAPKVISRQEFDAMNNPDMNSPFRTGSRLSLRANDKQQQTVTPKTQLERVRLEAKAETEYLTNDDWKHLVGGCKTQKFSKGDVIIKSGSTHQRLYQIIQGTCKVESVTQNSKYPVGILSEPEIFGETSFLIWESGSSHQVVAEEDVTLYAIEGYFVSILFNMIPGFAGRFFRFLGAILSRRHHQIWKHSSAIVSNYTGHLQG
eukprot:TRINITY_DN5526_c0_g1_i4.p1 TRINITY_DN5526_c0_g1~~TRINITY_DN5526_c0_g1_i4.p1  ORF type:complete len:392 (+),score=89.08 TRINITY_DN5526_c0_g1_i4:153-1328(+)